MDIVVDKNIVSFTLPPHRSRADFIVKTGSRATQYVTVSGGATKEFSGSGEGQIIGNFTVDESTSPVKLTLKFEYDSGGKRAASGLQYGGPYTIRNFNLLAVVAENGDDKDYNDCVMSVNWKS